MAYFNMFADGVTGTNNWLNQAGATAGSGDVDANDGDTEYITESTHNHEITFTMVSPVDYISPTEVASITTVKIWFSGRGIHVSRNEFVIVEQTGTDISNGTDTVTVASSGTYSYYSGTGELQASSGVPWTMEILENLEIKLKKFRNSSLGGGARISYLYAQVTYEPRLQNATFFGANF